MRRRRKLWSLYVFLSELLRVEWRIDSEARCSESTEQRHSTVIVLDGRRVFAGGLATWSTRLTQPCRLVITLSWVGRRMKRTSIRWRDRKRKQGWKEIMLFAMQLSVGLGRAGIRLDVGLHGLILKCEWKDQRDVDLCPRRRSQVVTAAETGEFFVSGVSEFSACVDPCAVIRSIACYNSMSRARRSFLDDVWRVLDVFMSALHGLYTMEMETDWSRKWWRFCPKNNRICSI